jgi:hypothetical protein
MEREKEAKTIKRKPDLDVDDDTGSVAELPVMNKLRLGGPSLESEGNQFNGEDSEETDAIRQRNLSEKIAFENPDIPTVSESLWNFFLLPVILYGGFGRSVYVSERKKNFLQMAHGQEIFLHSLPLGMIVIVNFQSIDKKGTLDWACMAAATINLC